MAKNKDKNKNSNPLKTLADMYHNQVKEEDKKGLADQLKWATDYWFSIIKEQVEKLKEVNLTTINFTDVIYLDDYFIFGKGTNKVIHFHIKECPGWKFGIWWGDLKETESGGRTFDGTFFTQYELAIDKFKPSYSAINIDFNLSIDRYEFFSSEIFNDIPKIITFIHQHPALAFCRDYCDWDYNLEYHTEEEAEKELKEYLEYKVNEEKYTKENDKKIIDFFQNKVIPVACPGAKIMDRGENWVPRFFIATTQDIAKIPCGCYNIFIEDGTPDDEYVTEYKQILKDCEETAKKYNFHWFSPIDPTCTVYKKTTIKELKEFDYLKEISEKNK